MTRGLVDGWTCDACARNAAHERVSLDHERLTRRYARCDFRLTGIEGNVVCEPFV